MFKPQPKTGNPAQDLALMVEMARAVTEGETDMLANLANLSAVVKAHLVDTNWAGFYLLKNGELVLGPFQGLPACIRIPLGRGVCGAAAKEEKTILVEDVHAFPGHIACDAASRSEVVVPVFRGGRLYAVLDVDSPLSARFGGEEQAALEKIAALISALPASAVQHTL